MTLDPIPDPKKAVRIPNPRTDFGKPYREPLPPGEHPHKPPRGYSILGKKIPYIDARLKVTGQAIYADDISLPHMLHARIVRSTHPHAKIVSIDDTEARSIPGVVAVLTGKDVGPSRFGVLPLTKDESPLAVDRVRYIGEPVAAVAAEEDSVAARASRKVRVVYDPLPVYLDPHKGLKPVEVKIHPEIGIDSTNVQKYVDQEFGDVESQIRASSLVVRRKFRFSGLTHAFTEPHAVLAHYDPNGRLTVWSSTQVPHYVQRALSEVTGLPMHRIRVIRPAVGGGFGGKSDPLPHEMIAALLSMKTGRPVKIRFDRDESFYSGRGRHPSELEVALGFDEKGRITLLDTEAVLDGGAYASFGIITTYYNGVLSLGPYKVPAFRYKGRRVYTNHIPSGAMRGHGAVNSRCALEVVLDEAAEALGMDPFDLRLLNLLPPYSRTINEFRITSNGLEECLRIVRKESGWDERFRKLPLGRGLGLGCGFYISGSNLPVHWDIDPKKYPQSTVHLKVDIDGGITVHTMAAEIGQGSDTLAAAIVAEVLGVGISRVRVLSSDSDSAPLDLGSYSSRVTFMMGNAARQAAENLREEIAQAVSEKTGHPVEFWIFEGERIVSRVDPSVSVSWDEAVRWALAGKGALVSRGTFVSTPMGGTFKGATAGLAPAYSMSAYVAEVEVDVETGIWRARKVWAAHDCGKVLNRLAVEGQIEGSIHMGLGQVMSETLEYHMGNLRNPNLLDYKIPTPLETPQIEVFLVESNDAEGPFGAKEAGEGPLLPILPAVLNALYDAVGVRMYDLPATPDRVFAALERQGGPRKPRPIPSREVVLR